MVKLVTWGGTVSAGGAQRLAALAGVADQTGISTAAAATPVANVRRCHVVPAAIEGPFVACSIAHHGVAVRR
jgi:hypothetical protein